MKASQSLIVLTFTWWALLFAEAEEVNLAGKWKATTTLPSGNERDAEVVLVEKEGKWSGIAKGQNGERVMTKVSVEGAKLVFALDVQVSGNDLVFQVDAKADEANTLQGSWTATGTDGAEVATGDWKAERYVNPLVGEWNATALDPDDKKMQFPVVIKEADGKLKALFRIGEHSLPTDEVSLEDKKATLKVPFPFDGTTYPITITATLSDDQLDGRWVAYKESGDEEASGDWKAVRAGAAELAGAWTVTATLGDGTENSSVYHFDSDGDAWKGKAVRDAGEIAFDKVVLDGKDLVVDMELPYDGSTIELRVKAAFSEADAIIGKWIVFDASGQESATGDWKAARKTDS